MFCWYESGISYSLLVYVIEKDLMAFNCKLSIGSNVNFQLRNEAFFYHIAKICDFLTNC